MNNKKPNKTIADIVAEKRRCADKIERDCAEKMKLGKMVSDCYARELIADIRAEADELEAVWKRERVTERHEFGDAAAMREALRTCLDFIMRLDRAFNPFMQKLLENATIEKAQAALSAPPRNCDMGTPEEQSARFDDHCKRHMGCITCPLREKDGGVPKHCEFAWAQMPYESEAKK